MRLRHEVALDRGQVRSKGLAKPFMKYYEVTQKEGLIQANRWEVLAT